MNKKIDDENKYKMYIVINNNLSMGKGKIVAQACHVACQVTRILHGTNNEKYDNWLRAGEAKIVLKATEKEINELIDKYDNSKTSENNRCVYIHDAGFTQIPAGSLTAIAFFPIQKKDAPKEISKLKLL